MYILFSLLQPVKKIAGTSGQQFKFSETSISVLKNVAFYYFNYIKAYISFIYILRYIYNTDCNSQYYKKD